MKIWMTALMMCCLAGPLFAGQPGKTPPANGQNGMKKPGQSGQAGGMKKPGDVMKKMGDKACDAGNKIKASDKTEKMKEASANKAR